MDQILEAIESNATAEQFAKLKVPTSYRGVCVEKDDVEMFAGLPSAEKDPRKSLKIKEVPVPEIAPDECLVAMMASSINFNTVWSSIFEPISTFGSLT